MKKKIEGHTLVSVMLTKEEYGKLIELSKQTGVSAAQLMRGYVRIGFAQVNGKLKEAGELLNLIETGKLSFTAAKN